MLLYYLSLKLINNLISTNTHASENSISQISQLSLTNIPLLIKNTYSHFISKFIHPNTYHVSFIRIIILLIILFALYLGIDNLLKLNNKNKIVITLLVILLPLCLDGIYILVNGTIHDLMTYQIFLVYIFFIYLLTKKYEQFNYIKLISILLLGLLIFDLTVYANQIYVKKDLEYRKTAEIANRIIYRIEDTDGYESGKTPIAFIGCMQDSSLFTPYEDMNYDAVGIIESSALTYYQTYDKYFNDQLNYNLNILDEDESRKLSTNPNIKEMPYFPNKDAVKIVDGILIVKVSDFKD